MFSKYRIIKRLDDPLGKAVKQTPFKGRLNGLLYNSWCLLTQLQGTPCPVLGLSIHPFIQLDFVPVSLLTQLNN